MKVLLVLPYGPAPFMETDIDILSRHFTLDVVVHNRGKMRLGFGILRRLLVNRPHVLLMWFIVPSYALALTVLARILGIKVAFVTGGYDIVSMPEIGFGALRVPLFRLLFKPTLHLANLVLPFSLSAAKQLHRYARPRRCKVVYPGADSAFFTVDTSVEREALALTVSPITESSILQKGLRTFVSAARYAPEMRWVLVGNSPDGSIDSLVQFAAPNVEFVDRFLPAIELRDLYRRASCYVQVSAHEGFGVAVAEAMLCGAVPVVTEVYSLPEVTGGLGQYVPLNDPKAVASAALLSQQASQREREVLRTYISERFSYPIRERELVTTLQRLVRGSR